MVQIDDMYYAWSSDEEIAERGECGGAVTSVLKFLLEEGIVDAVLAVKKGADLYDAVPTLITDPEKVVESAGSLHCGTLNMGQIIRKYFNGARDIKIAVTTKPCDAMTIVELMKRNKIERNNMVMIGLNCGGTLPPVKARKMIEEFYEIDPDIVVKEEIARGNLIIETSDQEEKEISIDILEDEGFGRRTNCRRCEINIPRMADLAFGNWGVIGPLTGKATFVEVCSDKGAEILKKSIKKNILKVQDPIPKGIEIRANIDKAMVNLAKKWQNKDFQNGDLSTLDQYGHLFAKCIKCYGCREVCPICHCESCSIQSDSPEWLEKGVIPPSPMFHFIRLVHMVDSCTNCGQCEEVCPSEIPLAKIWHKIGVQIQDEFKYYPGQDVEQRPPLSVIDKEPGEE